MNSTTSFENTLAFAQRLDQADSLYPFRHQFHRPQHHEKPVLYFCGNSLGLQPLKARQEVEAMLEKWATQAVDGHFESPSPWMNYHRELSDQMAALVGAKPLEVVIMNTLTVNLHLMMVSFYKPTPKRFKIMMEAKAFPSDIYALQAQVAFHGFDPAEAIVEVAPAPGKKAISTGQIVEAIETHRDSLAMVMLGGVHYYTGQAFDLGTIARAARQAGAIVGYDLAHAAGNVPLELHNWEVDFAVWCTYKYLNSGPGGPSGVFVHEKYAQRFDLPRFTGWWGYEPAGRFKMEKTFRPAPGAEGWQLSNAPILSFAPLKASLALFHEAGFTKLRAKSLLLTAYLEYLVRQVNEQAPGKPLEILTPENPEERGCQLSLSFANGMGKSVFQYLTGQGVIGDWREPNVIRIAPVPLYNSFEEVLRFSEILSEALRVLSEK
jgi:kynureninase